MVTISMKSVVQLFRVKDVQSLDSCVLLWTSSLAETLKLKSGLLNQRKQTTIGEKVAEKVYVDTTIVADDGTVIVLLTDKSRFEYDEKARTWREISPAFEWP